MFDDEQFDDWHHQDVVDPENQQVGRLEEVYRDNYGTSAGFACVRTGLFGRRLTFVPLEGAIRERDHVRVAYLADQIKHAPNVEPDGVLTAEEEAALFEYYGLNAPLDPQAEIPPPVPVEPPRLVRHYSREDAERIAAARRMAAEDGLRDGRYPVMAGGMGAIEARLSALEARIAELETWRGSR
jgi:hypothetical protein